MLSSGVKDDMFIIKALTSATLSLLGVISCSDYSDETRKRVMPVCEQKSQQAVNLLGPDFRLGAVNVQRMLKMHSLFYEELKRLPFSDCIEGPLPQDSKAYMVFISRGPRPGEAKQILIVVDGSDRITHLEARFSHPDPLGTL